MLDWNKLFVLKFYVKTDGGTKKVPLFFCFVKVEAND